MAGVPLGKHDEIALSASQLLASPSDFRSRPLPGDENRRRTEHFKMALGPVRTGVKFIVSPPGGVSTMPSAAHLA